MGIATRGLSLAQGIFRQIDDVPLPVYVCVCWWDGMVGYHKIRLFFDVPSLGMCPSRQNESKWLSEDPCHQCGLLNGTLSLAERSIFYISSQSSYSQMSISRSKLRGVINTKLLLFIFSPNWSLWDVCNCDSCSTSVAIYEALKKIVGGCVNYNFAVK